MTPKLITKIKVSERKNRRSASVLKNKKNSSKKNVPKIKEEDTFKQAPVFKTSLTHGYAVSQELKTKKFNDKNKNLIMFIGVGAIMVVVIIVWILNLGKTMGPDAFSVTAKDSPSKQSFTDIKNELNASFSQFKDGVDKLKELSTNNAASPSEVITPTIEPNITSTTLPNTLPK
jgi:hypothetical protein